MAPNETSALLQNYRDHQTTNSCRNGYDVVDGSDHHHIVYVNKDSNEYEPLFSINEYSAALTLDELLPYKLDPWWQNVRRILFLSCWLTLIMTFITACLLTYLQLGRSSCNIMDSSLSTPTSSALVLTTTTVPTTIAKIIATEMLSSKLPILTVP